MTHVLLVALHGASFQQMGAEQVDGTSPECKECKKRKNGRKDSSSGRIPLNRCSVFLYPRLLAGVQKSLNNRSQLSLIAFL